MSKKEKATMDCEGKGLPTIEYFNEDCMVGMARYPDKYFDIAIVLVRIV